MNDRGSDTRVLGAGEIEAFARDSDAVSKKCRCRAIDCAGWTSVPVSFEESRYRRVGRVAPISDKEPTWREYHPQGTRYGSPQAPIALGHFPFNRCELWQCVDCGRCYLRYTEFGGYFVDRRIRELNASLVVRTEPPEEG